MSKLFPASYSATAAIGAVLLVVCSLIPGLARADGSASTAVGVVDAFDNARAVRDVNAVSALLDTDASVVDRSGNRATGIAGVYQLLPIDETVEFGPRTQTEGGEVVWAETVMQTVRPSWENNPNWWVDGNDALEAEILTPGVGAPPGASEPQTGERDPAATSDTRVMRAIVTQGRITQLTMTRSTATESGGSGSNAWSQAARTLALVTAVALLGYLLLATVAAEPAVRPAREGTWLVPGLQGWLAARRGREPN